jgi:hypothetical protein
MTKTRFAGVHIATALFTVGGIHWALAQTSAPSVQWSVATKRVSAGERRGALEVAAIVPQGWHVYALHQAPGGPTPLLVTLDADTAVRVVGPPSGTAPESRHDPSFDLDTEYYTRDFALLFPIESAQALGDSPPLPVSVRFQLCSERECQPPKTVHLLAPIITDPK